MPELTVTQEDAERFIVRCLRMNPGEYAHYGYELYLPNVMGAFISEALSIPNEWHRTSGFYPRVAPTFYAAAWALCVRGILRPGVSNYMKQATDDGAGGNGYSVTPWGQLWLGEVGEEDYVATDPVRFAELLKPFARLFGPGFLVRANEAIRCYNAHAHLACCVMCGAAAESILLTLARVKVNDREHVLRDYQGRDGRRKVEAILNRGLPPRHQKELQALMALLKDWRDEAGHGLDSDISNSEAYIALTNLVRLARFTANEYGTLTQP